MEENKSCNIIGHYFCVIHGKKEMFYLTMHLTHLFYDYIASDILW